MDKGFFYVMTNPAQDGLVLVGTSARHPEERLLDDDLSGPGVPVPYELRYYALLENSTAAMEHVHDTLARWHVDKQFYETTPGAAIRALEQSGAEILYRESDTSAHENSERGRSTRPRFARATNSGKQSDAPAKMSPGRPGARYGTGGAPLRSTRRRSNAFATSIEERQLRKQEAMRRMVRTAGGIETETPGSVMDPETTATEFVLEASPDTTQPSLLRDGATDAANDASAVHTQGSSAAITEVNGRARREPVFKAPGGDATADDSQVPGPPLEAQSHTAEIDEDQAGFFKPEPGEQLSAAEIKEIEAREFEAEVEKLTRQKTGGLRNMLKRIKGDEAEDEAEESLPTTPGASVVAINTAARVREDAAAAARTDKNSKNDVKPEAPAPKPAAQKPAPPKPAPAPAATPATKPAPAPDAMPIPSLNMSADRSAAKAGPHRPAHPAPGGYGQYGSVPAGVVYGPNGPVALQQVPGTPYLTMTPVSMAGGPAIAGMPMAGMAQPQPVVHNVANAQATNASAQANGAAAAVTPPPVAAPAVAPGIANAPPVQLGAPIVAPPRASSQEIEAWLSEQDSATEGRQRGRRGILFSLIGIPLGIIAGGGYAIYSGVTDLNTAGIYVGGAVAAAMMLFYVIGRATGKSQDTNGLGNSPD